MENNNKMIKTDKTQIEKIFEEAPGGQAGGYPEECCDAAGDIGRGVCALGRAGVREDSGVHSLKINDYVIF